MSDSLRRSDSIRSARGQQPQRNSWRNSSVRSSQTYDGDFLHPSSGPGSARHSLRPADSRFSLHEQFAATRRDYDFGFDDASSIWERGSAVASVAEMEDGEGDETVKVDVDFGLGGDGGEVRVGRDFYDLLCLPRDGTATPEMVREAYWRLFRLFDVEGAPEHVRGAAGRYFADVQGAFEALIAPGRRYEREVDDDGMSVSEEDVVRETEKEEKGPVPVSLGRQLRCQPTSDVGVRFACPDDMVLPLTPRQCHMAAGRIRALDFAIGHTVHMGVPVAGRLTQQVISTTSRLADDLTQEPRKVPAARCGVPILSVSASSYGLMGDSSALPAGLLSDRYQPLLPETLPRNRLSTLAEGRPSPIVTAKYRQELFWRVSQSHESEEERLPDTVIEVEADLVHDPSITARVYNAIPVEGEQEPVHVEVMASTGSSWRLKTPRLGLALHRRIAGRTLFLCVDSGTWSAAGRDEGSETCRYFDEFSRIGSKKRRLPFDIPLPIAATAETGCSFGPGSEMIGLGAGQALTRPADRGIKGLDTELDVDSHLTRSTAGSWTISAAATSSTTLASYLRYGQDLGHHLGQPPGMVRAEVELAATTNPAFGQQSQHIALRFLKRMGLFKIGHELALSPHAVHVSLYVSRGGWRFRLPFMVAGGNVAPTTAHKLFFLSAALPFAVLAAMNWWQGSRSLSTTHQRRQRLQNLSKEDLQDYIAVRRAEADRLVEVLTWATERRQNSERAKGGLVILSAKYGIKSPGQDGAWMEAEEVADVTAAVAALVDEKGRLVIPAGARKSRLLGFWDPAPLRTKMLVVRYLWRGKERVGEVRGREELVLPGVEM